MDARDLGAFIPAALDDMGLDPYAFRVYCRLCRRAGTGHAFESVPNMATACGIADRTVQRALRRLEELGLIHAQHVAGKSTVYRLRGVGDATPVPQSPHPRTSVTPGGVPESPKGSPFEGKTQKRFIAPTLEEVKAYARSRGVPEGEAVRFFDRNVALGWKVDRRPMRDWPRAFQTWERNWRAESRPVSNSRYGVEEAV